VAAVSVLVQFAGGIAFFALLRRKFLQMRISPRYFSWRLLKNMSSPGFGFFVLSVSGSIIWSIDNLVISGVMGIAFLASFAIAERLVASLQRIIAIPFNTSGPTMTALRAEGNADALKRLFVLSTKLALSVAILFSVELTSFGRSFIALWVGRSVLVDRNTFLVLVAILVANVLQQPCYNLIVATTRHQMYSRLVVCEAILNLTLSWWWAHKWGVLGVALGTLLPHVLISGSYLTWLGIRINHLTFSEVWGRNIVALAFPTVMTIAVGFLLHNFAATWLQWMISVGLTLLTFASACWIVSTSEEERGILAAAFRTA
jgi:O-antigen/teichoic acid export membrane protein